MARKTKDISFEVALEELSGIVERMEKGEESLQQLLDDYSKGIRLSEKCLKDLENAENIINTVIRDNGNSFTEEELEIS